MQDEALFGCIVVLVQHRIPFQDCFLIYTKKSLMYSVLIDNAFVKTEIQKFLAAQFTWIVYLYVFCLNVRHANNFLLFSLHIFCCMIVYL